MYAHTVHSALDPAPAPYGYNNHLTTVLNSLGMYAILARVYYQFDFVLAIYCCVSSLKIPTDDGHTTDIRNTGL